MKEKQKGFPDPKILPPNKTKPVRDTLTKPEVGGPDGPDPTRYGDWERRGRCIDF